MEENYVVAMSYSPVQRPNMTILDAGGFGVHTLVELTIFRAIAVADVRSLFSMGPGGRVVRGTIGAALGAWQESRRAGYGDLTEA